MFRRKKHHPNSVGEDFRVPWTARRSNQSILKEIIGRTDAETEAPILSPPDAKN